MTEKVEQLLKSIDNIAKVSDEELKTILADYPALDKIIKAIETYEKTVSKLFRRQKKQFIKAIKQYFNGDSADNPLVGAILDMVMSDVLDADDFAKKMTAESITFLTKTTEELTSVIMDTIDKDVQFEVLSDKTVKWIDNWAEELGDIMKLTTHANVEKSLRKGIEEGWGIDKIVQDLKDAPEFSRHRARMTAVTETLTASSVAQQEAYTQSPAVTGKTWLHSGSKKNDPRKHHVDLHDTTIDVDADFEINAPTGTYNAEYPRAINLPASERIFCHCVLTPSVDEDILGLSKDEKEIMRQQVLST